MKIKRLITGPLETNTYILILEETTILVDPGGDPQQVLAEAPNTVDLLLLTHGHPDHTAYADTLAEKLGAQIAYCSLDRPVHQAYKTLARIWGLTVTDLPPPDIDTCKNTNPAPGIQILHTPGHTPGSITIHIPRHHIALTGDTLFNQGVGRTDLPYANPQQLAQTLHMLANTLPRNTRILPGHGPPSTLEYELKHNPYLILAQKDPKKLAQILQQPL